MSKIVISIILFITALFLTYLSLPPYDNELIILLSAITILIGGFALGFFISAWSKKDRKERFKNNLKYTFGISSLIYITGYIFASIQGLF